MPVVDAFPATATMVEALRWRAAHDGELRAYTVVVDGEREEVSLTFVEWNRRTRGIAGRLQSLAEKGERALLLCPDILDCIVGMFGGLYAGLTVIPSHVVDLEGEVDRLSRLWQSSGAEVGVTTRKLLPHVLAVPLLNRLQWVVADDNPEETVASWKEPTIDRNIYPVDLKASIQHCHPALRGHAAAALGVEVDGEERLAIAHEVDATLPAEQHGEIVSAIRGTTSVRHGVQAHTVALVPPGAIPRAGQGKIARTACRARLIAGILPVLLHDVLDPVAGVLSESYAAPRTETERTLARIWERCVGRARTSESRQIWMRSRPSGSAGCSARVSVSRMLCTMPWERC
jgi:acyl-CoA synthetase (AMP-forming)/AMP-acid ligase II